MQLYFDNLIDSITGFVSGAVMGQQETVNVLTKVTRPLDFLYFN